MGYRMLDDRRCFRGEIAVGTMAGYNGEERDVKPADVASYVDEFRKDGTQFAYAVWTRGSMLYGAAERETVILVTVHKPNASEAEMSTHCQELAAFLGDALHQERMYIDVIPMRTIVTGRS